MFGRSENDVLCDRGHSSQGPGDRLYRRLVSENKALYQQSLSPSHKRMVALSIVEAIYTRGGRFLRMSDGGDWVETSTEKVLIRTCQALREPIGKWDLRYSSSSSSHQSINSSSRSKQMKVKAKNDLDDCMAWRTRLSSNQQGDSRGEALEHSSCSVISLSDDSESSQSQTSNDDMMEGDEFEPLSLGHVMGSWLTPEFVEFLIEVTSNGDPLVLPG